MPAASSFTMWIRLLVSIFHQFSLLFTFLLFIVSILSSCFGLKPSSSVQVCLPRWALQDHCYCHGQFLGWLCVAAMHMFGFAVLLIPVFSLFRWNSYSLMWLPLVIEGASKSALQCYSKCYCAANVTKTFAFKGVQHLQIWIAFTSLSVKVFITLATQ
jgi:hypothetical protein